MKETQQHNSDVIQIVNQVQQKIKKLLLGSIIPHKGHILYEFDKSTYKLVKAKYNQTNANFCDILKSNKPIKKEVIIKENCFYISSLNVKNASKKIHKQLGVAYVIDATNE